MHKIIAYLTTENSENEPRYMTRSKTSLAEKQNPEGTHNIHATDDVSPKEPIVTGKGPVSEVAVLDDFKHNEVNSKSPETTHETVKPPTQNLSFDLSIWDRKLGNIDDIESEELIGNETPFNEGNERFSANNNALLWHVRFGHASLDYLKSMQRMFPGNKNLQSVKFGESIKDCEICMIAKFNKLPFSKTRQRAVKPLEIIHSDTMGPITPQTLPKGYRFISVKYLYVKLRQYNMSKNFGGPRAYPIIGNSFVFFGDLNVITKRLINMSQKYTLPGRLWLGSELYVILEDPEQIKVRFISFHCYFLK
ncbi:hypothetical protein M0802_014051 [Mischocyttarus mexicanus]|nr:hypothetical protein M0802_014051 [Mischocyttarus mexicanus]